MRRSRDRRPASVTAGENPERMKNEVAFAMLCGVAPLPASGDKTRRYRPNRGGDRAANCALHMAAISRLRVDPRTPAPTQPGAQQSASPRRRPSAASNATWFASSTSC